jgi:hypothetical protein
MCTNLLLMEIYFQKGKYPVRQVIFCGMDSVLGSLLTSILFKPNYGKIDIIHLLRESEQESDVELLLKTERSVISTCWDPARTWAAIPEYAQKRNWAEEDIRVYELGHRIEKSDAMIHALQKRFQITHKQHPLLNTMLRWLDTPDHTLKSFQNKTARDKEGGSYAI